MEEAEAGTSLPAVCGPPPTSFLGWPWRNLGAGAKTDCTNLLLDQTIRTFFSPFVPLPGPSTPTKSRCPPSPAGEWASPGSLRSTGWKGSSEPAASHNSTSHT